MCPKFTTILGPEFCKMPQLACLHIVTKQRSNRKLDAWITSPMTRKSIANDNEKYYPFLASANCRLHKKPYLIHRAHPYLALGGRQPFGFWVIPKNVIETIRGGLETPSRLKTVAVCNFTLSSENVRNKFYVK